MFLLGLCQALRTLHRCYKEVKEFEQAMKTVERAIGVLTPEFQNKPDVFGALMVALVRDYLECAKEGQLAIREDLVKPVVGALGPLMCKKETDGTE